MFHMENDSDLPLKTHYIKTHFGMIKLEIKNDAEITTIYITIPVNKE